MPKEAIQTQAAPAPVGAYSQAVKVGPLLFCSGQIPLGPDGIKVQGSVTRETEQALGNLQAVLEAAGASVGQVVKTTVYLTDMADYKFVNQVYERFFSAPYPARSAVQVAKLPRDVKVEIDAIAVIA